MPRLDDIDLKIVQLLRKDGRMTHEAISKELGMTRPAIHKRVQKLTDSGVIKSYTAELNWDKLGLPIHAMINLWVDTQNFTNLIEEIMELSNSNHYILSCERITGQYSLMLRVRAGSTNDLTMLHDKLLATNHIKETMTSMILEKVEPDTQSRFG